MRFNGLVIRYFPAHLKKLYLWYECIVWNLCNIKCNIKCRSIDWVEWLIGSQQAVGVAVLYRVILKAFALKLCLRG